MDFTLTPEQEAFRQRVRAWLEASIPREWRAVRNPDIPRAEAFDMLRRWQRQLYDAGFIGLTWPREAGGAGLTFLEEMILHQEMALDLVTVVQCDSVCGDARPPHTGLDEGVAAPADAPLCPAGLEALDVDAQGLAGPTGWTVRAVQQ